jgi:menaquinone-dependent protoporphyrinogen oxidase
MSKKLLVTYASKAGSTKEVAEFISDSLSASGFETIVLNVNKVKNVNMFDAIIIGTPLRFDKPVHDSISFVQRYSNDLKKIPVACFALGSSMKYKLNGDRDKVINMLNPLLSKIPEPFEIGLFGGKINYERLSWFWKFLAEKDNSGLMDEGDWRDWEEIESWIDNIKRFEALKH